MEKHTLTLNLEYIGEMDGDIARALEAQLDSYTKFIMSNVNHNSDSLKISCLADGDAIPEKDDYQEKSTDTENIILPS